jgi:hypothetical protein
VESGQYGKWAEALLAGSRFKKLANMKCDIDLSAGDALAASATGGPCRVVATTAAGVHVVAPIGR